MKLITIELDELEENINRGVKVYLEYLRDNEFVEKEMFDFLLKNTAIIIKQPSFFNKVWNKVFNDPEKYHYIVVVQMSMKDKNDETKPPVEKKKGKVIKLVKEGEKNEN